MAEETTEVAQTLPSLDVELTQNEIKGQIEGYEYLIDVAKTQPEEYQKIFGGLPPEAKNFIRFLKERAQIKNNPIEKIDPGPMTIVTVSRTKGTTDPLIIIENRRGMQPVKKSLAAILNELESEGFRVAPGTVGGSMYQAKDAELTLILRR
eukprot:TRINITY_DN512_c0_g1_i3.p1 TRINITY_DN512_c0_g1~~TRINITY_DN512_c0_g1_i3.p1  ORF type:complete len:151 (+),score=53.27 TRINITY_DN512_c0_g1_i3:567-1019(+)